MWGGLSVLFPDSENIVSVLMQQQILPQSIITHSWACPTAFEMGLNIIYILHEGLLCTGPLRLPRVPAWAVRLSVRGYDEQNWWGPSSTSSGTERPIWLRVSM